MKIVPSCGGSAGTASVVRNPMNTLGASTAYSINPGPLTRPEVTPRAGSEGIAPHSSSFGPSATLASAAPIPSASPASAVVSFGDAVAVPDPTRPDIPADALGAPGAETSVVLSPS